MNLLQILAIALLALTLSAGANGHSTNSLGHDGKSSHSQPDRNPGQQSGWERDPDRDQGTGKGQRDQHEPRDCDNDRHNHGKPQPPRPPRPPKVPIGVPAVPSGLIAEAVSLFQVNLRWTDNSTNELGFKIERSFDGTNFAQIAQILPNATAYRDLNRFPDTKYFYRVRAFNAKGNSAYSPVARTQTPAPPCRLSVVASSGFDYGSPTLDQSELVAIAAGGYRRLVLKADGTVIDLANNMVNQVSNLTDAIAIAAGDDHGLALQNDGTVVGWGEDNYYGQATPPPNLNNVTAIAAGSTHSLALKNDGTVVAWGEDTWWQARPPTNLTGVVAIAAGLHHSLALRSDGTVVGWGGNDQNAAQPPPGLQNVIAIAAGSSHSLALRGDGTLIGWGTSPAANIPTNLTGVIAIAAGDNFSSALKSDGSINWWSGNNSGGFPTPEAALVSSFTGVVALSIRVHNSMFLATLPAVPSSLLVRLVASNSVYLTWEDSSSSETSYIIERETLELGGASGLNWEVLATLPADSSNFVDDSVMAGASYWYSVRPGNACGRPPFGAGAMVSVLPPTNAPYLAPITVRGGSALLSWYTESVGAVAHQLERAPDVSGQPGDWSTIAVVPADSLLSFGSYSETRYTDSSPPRNSTNWYRVRAENGLGVSPYSQPSPMIIRPLAGPRYLTATINDTDRVRLSWATDYWYDQAGFRIERATNLLNGSAAWEEIAIIAAANPPASAYADTTALAGRTYWYRIRAFNEVGLSDYSLPTSIELRGPPTASLFVFAFTNTVFLFAAPAYPGFFNSEVTGPPPEFERAENVNGVPGVWGAIAPEPQNNSLFFADKDRAANTTYWYRARLSTWLGETPFSTPVSVKIVPPPPPLEVRAYLGSSNHITLRWRPVYRYELGRGNQLEAASFRVQRAIDTASALGEWTDIAMVGLTNSQYYGFADTAAGGGQTYRYRIAAVNVVGPSPYVEAFPVQLLPPPQPTLEALVYINQAVLSWGIGVSGNIGARLERAPDASGSPGAWTVIATFPLAEFYPNSYVDKLPAQVAGYWYRVQVFNWLGDSAYSAPMAVDTELPQPPSLFAAQIGSTNQISLSWYQSNNDAEGYEIERASVSGGSPGAWEKVITNFPGGLLLYPAIDSNVVALADYAYRIRATNTIGWSDYSDVLFVRTERPPAPLALRADYFGGRVTLYWNPPYNSYGYGEIFGYEIERAIAVGGSLGEWTQIGRDYTYSYLDETAPAGTVCWYRVRSVNWIGPSEYAPLVSVEITPPSSPSYLVALPPQILTLVLTNQDVLLTWQALAGTTNVVEAAPAPQARFEPLTANLRIEGDGLVTTNYLDAGVGTNSPARFYRIRSLP